MSGPTADTARAAQIEASRRLWDERFSHPNYLFGYRPNDFLVECEVLLRRRSRVLVLGDGEGRNGVWLAKRGHRVTTVDLSAVGVAKAQALAKEMGATGNAVELDMQVGDALTWLASDAGHGPWDAVVSIWLPLPPRDRAKLAELLSSRMSPRGWLVLEGYAPDQVDFGPWGPEEINQLASAEELRSEWPHWRLDVRAKRRRIFEGMAHQGSYSVLQVLGRVCDL